MPSTEKAKAGDADISYITNFLEKILGGDSNKSKEAECEEGKDYKGQPARLNESYSSESMSSEEKHSSTSSEDDVPVTVQKKSGTKPKLIEETTEEEEEEEEEVGKEESEEERILARLPKDIPKMVEKDWNFPTSKLKIEKLIANPGQFSKIQLAKYEGKNVCVKQVQVEDIVYAVTEITLLKYLSNEHVLGFIGAARETIDGTPCIVAVTEFMQGGSLTDALKADASKPKRNNLSFDWSKRIRVALHASKALEYIHKRGVIHRDVKSDNLLLTSRGNDVVCRLADFGFARGLFGKHELQEGVETRSSRTFGTMTRSKHERAQTICGTDETMAPEMFLHSEDAPYTTAVDIFGLGCVLIEMCCGQFLTDGFVTRPPQRNFAFDEGEVRRKALKTCPSSLLELAINCTHYEPEDRLTPSECREWLEELTNEIVNGKVEVVGASLSTHSDIGQTAAISDSPHSKKSGNPAASNVKPPAGGCCVIS